MQSYILTVSTADGLPQSSREVEMRGEEAPPAPADEVQAPKNAGTGEESPLGTFEKFLSVWVLLAIVAGVLLGTALPAFAALLVRLTVFEINLPIAFLMLVMIAPMMFQLEFSALLNVRRYPTGLVRTLPDQSSARAPAHMLH